VACLENGEDPRSVPGLVLNRSGEQVRTGVRPLVEDLDELPAPARWLTERHRARYYMGLNRPLAVVETARGCPYHCSFCSVWRFYRGRYRAKSPDRVAEEVAAVAEPSVLFTDDNFLADVERARQIALAIEKCGLRRHYNFQARSDSIVAHPEVIGEWRRVRLDHVFVGLEKIDDAGLAGVGK